MVVPMMSFQSVTNYLLEFRCQSECLFTTSDECFGLCGFRILYFLISGIERGVFFWRPCVGFDVVVGGLFHSDGFLFGTSGVQIQIELGFLAVKVCFGEGLFRVRWPGVGGRHSAARSLVGC